MQGSNREGWVGWEENQKAGSDEYPILSYLTKINIAPPHFAIFTKKGAQYALDRVTLSVLKYNILLKGVQYVLDTVVQELAMDPEKRWIQVDLG